MTDRDRSDAVAEAQGLASDLIDWLEERTASGYPTRRAATPQGLPPAGRLGGTPRGGPRPPWGSPRQACSPHSGKTPGAGRTS